MQSYFLVEYDHTRDQWSINDETLNNFIEFSCYSEGRKDEDDNGWFTPEFGSVESGMDVNAFIKLSRLVSQLNNE